MPQAQSPEALVPPVQSVESDYPLFQHQRDSIRRVLGSISTSPPRVLLHMPTGSGKTRTTMNVISQMLRQMDVDGIVVWLAHSEELCDQAIEEFQKAWKCLGDRSITVYRYYSKYDCDLSKVKGGFMIAGLGKLYNRSLSKMEAFFAMARRVRLVVMDEAHQAVAPTYQHLLELLAPTEKTAILGLSATPGRSYLKPGEDLKLADFFSHKKVTLQVEGYASPVDYLQEEGYLAKPEFIRLSYHPALTLTQDQIRRLGEELDIPYEIVQALERDEKRNLLIITKILEEAREGRKIIVFACSKDHAKMISNLLNLKGQKCATVTSDTPDYLRSKYIKSFRDTKELNILTNYGVLTTGFDAPKTNVAFIARPTNSVVLFSQMMGRVIRGPKVGGNKTCRVITVSDQIPGIKNIDEGFRFWEDIW